MRGDTPEAYSEETERLRWKEITTAHYKSQTEPRTGVSMFLALVDDECHELIPGTHTRWRTPYEHDVLLPQAMKDQGVPYTPSWNKIDPLPGSVSIRLKPGQALIRNGTTIHTGHTVPGRERNTLSIGWSKWSVATLLPACNKHAYTQVYPVVRNMQQIVPRVLTRRSTF